MSSGARVVTAYAPATNKDEVPATGWKILPNITNGLDTSNEMTESEMLKDGRIRSAGMVTGSEVTGDINAELMFGVYDELMAGAFWNDWTAGTSPDPDTLVVGDVRKMFAVTKDFQDVNLNHVFKGVHVNSMQIEISVGSMIKVTFGLMGLGYETSKTVSFAVNPAPAPDGAKVSGLSVGTILANGADIGVCVESFNFTIDNQAEIQKCLGSNLYGGNLLAMLANISGSFTLAYSPEAHDIQELQRSGAIMSLEVPINFENGDRYSIELPQIQVTGEIPSPSASDIVTFEASYTVVNESPIIKRTTA